MSNFRRRVERYRAKQSASRPGEHAAKAATPSHAKSDRDGWGSIIVTGVGCAKGKGVAVADALMEFAEVDELGSSAGSLLDGVEHHQFPEVA